jgi:hypothetical protein
MRVPNPEFQPMNAFAPYLLALHQTDLLAEAELGRRAKLVSKSQPGVPAWRRSLGGAFAYAARTFDPSRVDGEIRSGRIARAA